MNKDDIFEIEIEDLGNDGEGIGHVDGMTIFVKDLCPGDVAKVKIIKAKKNYCYGRAMEIIKPSKQRVEAKCPVARQCGGCVLQHLSYEEQLRRKDKKVRDCLSRIGGIKDIDSYMEPPVGMEDPYHYRNKMQFPVRRNKEGKCVVGFYAGRTHSIIPVDSCVIGHSVNDNIIKAVKAFVDKFNISCYDELTGKGFLRHILTRVGFTTNELMVCLIVNGESLPHKEVFTEMISDAVAEYNIAADKKDDNFKEIILKSIVININKEKTNRILGFNSKTIYGDGFITDYIGDVKFMISPESFFQVNPVQTVKLYSKALEYAALTGNETVWDMYCGIGTISLFLSDKAKKVYGVEIVPQAIIDAKKNAKLNNRDNIEFYTGKAEDVVTEIYEKKVEGSTADVVCVDPPRKGCDEKLLNTIISMAPKRVVYVSCDPATLARDVKFLSEHGYELKKAVAFDQFSHSMHVETVCLLSKLHEAKHHISVKVDMD